MLITYSPSPLWGPGGRITTECVKISFDSSKLAMLKLCYDVASNKWISYICVWDVPSGTLLHSLECNECICKIKWSSTDHYLLFKGWHGHWYLNTETFQEELLEHPSDRFQQPNHLYYDGYEHKVQLNGREGSLFLALPSHLDVKDISSQGDWACILSRDGQFLLLDTLGLEAYMDICNLQFQPFEVSCIS